MTAATNRKTLFIKDLQDGQQVNDLFLVRKKNYAETKAGKPYLALTLMDKSGEIEARLWDGAERVNEFVDMGKVLQVRAQVKLFREQLQLTINTVNVLDIEAVQLDDFMPSGLRSSAEMQTELTELLSAINNPFLKQLLHSVFQENLLKQFLTAPAAKMMHHAYLGGLAEHTLSVTRLAQRLCDNYPELDRDMLVAGALLHDIGKIEEFDFSSVPFNYTDSGRLVGHMVLGTEMVRNQVREIDGFPADLLNSLLHLILSHHGRHEFGSPCLPMTREAILLHYLDDIDAKMNLIDKLSAQVESGQYQWSDYQRSLERFLLLRGLDDQNPEAEHDMGLLVTDKNRQQEQRKESQAPPTKPLQKPLF